MSFVGVTGMAERAALFGLLEKERIVEYVPHPDHKRAKLVRLTEPGRTALKKLGLRQKLWANGTASHVRASEIQAAIDVVKKLARAWKGTGSARNEAHAGTVQVNGTVFTNPLVRRAGIS